jgi:hypothetical protein
MVEDLRLRTQCIPQNLRDQLACAENSGHLMSRKTQAH